MGTLISLLAGQSSCSSDMLRPTVVRSISRSSLLQRFLDVGLETAPESNKASESDPCSLVGTALSPRGGIFGVATAAVLFRRTLAPWHKKSLISVSAWSTPPQISWTWVWLVLASASSSKTLYLVEYSLKPCLRSFVQDFFTCVE